HWPQARRIVVVCGSRNNGGDGFVLARHALQSGRDVRVLQLPEHAPRGDLAERAQREYLEIGGAVDVFRGGACDADLIVDALFGICLSCAPDAACSALIEAMNASSAPIFALVVPRGVDAARGCVPGAAVIADCTLQFIGAHAGLATGAALEHGGQ